MRILLLILTITLLVSCQSNPPVAETEEVMPPVDLRRWGSESIKFPPKFAPEMPGGREELLFSPGWLNQEAEDYWTYVLLMELEEVGIDADRLDEIFEMYFDGLIGGVGAGKPFELPDDPADVSLQQGADSTYTGIIKTFDSFHSGQELNLHAFIEFESVGKTATILKVQISPKKRSAGHIWSSLRQAIDHVKFK